MSDPTFRLTVLTDEGRQFESDAVSVVAPGEMGFLGILANHAPLLTSLAPGRFVLRTPQQEAQRFQAGAGMLEVNNNQVTVLTDSWRRADA